MRSRMDTLARVVLAFALGAAGLTVGLTTAPPAADAAPTCATDAGVVTCTFLFTGAVQSWTVPAGVTSVTFDVYGGSGYRGTAYSSGYGGRATATFATTPGTVYQLVVGDQGGLTTGGFNGGGAPGAGSASSCYGGGGASDVRTGTDLSTRILVAGGGGGGCHTNGTAGYGGGLSGTSVSDSFLTGRAGSGNQTAGGAGGTGQSSNGTPLNGSPGTLGVGGQGASNTIDSTVLVANVPAGLGGGGGGGGHYGGGGGGAYFFTPGVDGFTRGRPGGGGSGFGPPGTVFSQNGRPSTDGIGGAEGAILVSYAVPVAPTLVLGSTRIEVSNTTGSCSASVAAPSVTTTGAPTVTFSPTLPGTFPVGTTSVTATASNGISPDATDNLTVVVNDTEAPTVAPTDPITVTATTASGAVVTYATPQGSDNCPGVQVARTAGLASGATFPIGTTTIAHTATDTAGLTGEASFTIEVVPATQTITFDTAAPTTATVGGSYTPSATATSGLPVTLSIDPASSGVCSITAGVVTFDGPGTCTINADQTGNTNYQAAPQTQQTFTVSSPLCAPGSFGTNGREPCTPAPIGFFVSSPGASAPTPCPPGTSTTAPGATTCVALRLTRTSGGVSATWDDDTTNETSYQLLRARNVAGVWSEWTFTDLPADTTTYLDTPVDTGLYAYLVRPIFTASNGDWRIATITISDATTPPTAPTNLTITGNTQLTWTDTATNELGFEILRARLVAGTWTEWQVLLADRNTTTRNDGPLNDGLYAYLIRAYNNQGASDWTITTAPAGNATTPPDAPTNLTTQRSTNHITLTWTDNSNGTDQEWWFELLRAELDGDTWTNWTPLGTVDQNTTTLTDPTTTPTTTYAYLIRAHNQHGTSPWTITTTPPN